MKTLSERWEPAALAGLLLYQSIVYGVVMRGYLHVSVVLLPWLIGTQGYRLYETIHIGYPPGWLWFNAWLLRSLPDDVARAQLATIIIAGIITLLVWWLARGWWGRPAGLVAAGLVAAWGPVMLEYFLYFELALGLLALIALALWHQHVPDQRRQWPVAAGFAIGLAILVKQHALAIVGVYLIWRLAGLDWRSALTDAARFISGVIQPLVPIAILLALQDVLGHGLHLMTSFNAGYFEMAAQALDGRELLLLAVWLLFVPPFVFHALRRREGWRSQDVLLLGLLVALSVPAYPRYGRFHLVGVLPFVALISAGAFALLSAHQSVWMRRAAALALAGVLAVGIVLPFYYRLRLGSVEAQYAALIPLAEWVREQAAIAPGDRVWILPDIDATGNFYRLVDAPPPRHYAQTYPWIIGDPDLRATIFAGLAAEPPAYVIRIDDLRFQVDTALWQFVDANYVSIAQTTLPNALNHVTLFARADAAGKAPP
ncbi:MAG: glycosyltransferase family 39 protein [Aggregatilineales bacterium]